MRNAFSLRQPLTLEFRLNVGDVRQHGVVFPDKQTGFRNIFDCKIHVRNVIRGKMQDPAGLQYAMDLRHQIGSHQTMSFVTGFWPRIRTEDVKTVQTGIRENDRQKMTCLHPEKSQIRTTGTMRFGYDFPHPVQHDVGRKDQPFRMAPSQFNGKITAAASEIKFNRNIRWQGHQIGKDHVLIAQDENFLIVIYFFLHSDWSFSSFDVYYMDVSI